MNAIVVRNLPEMLVDIVRDRILTGEVGGERAIRQDALAAELGVSKIPLREALTRLEQEGLVRSHANRGFFVRELSTREAEEVYALRLKLEPGVAALAATQATDAQRQTAIELIGKLDAASTVHDAGASIGALNRAFHLALIRPSGQPITTTLLERLHVMGERYVRKHLEPLGRDLRANEEHAGLLESWLERDVDAVIERMQAHIEQTLVDLQRQLVTEDS